MGYNLFQPATLGMKAQAHALNTIGANVANVNTGGYKRTDTRFETMISKTLSQQSDLGGLKPKDYQRIDNQGFFSSSDRNLDLAINGDGFFYLSPTFTVTEELYFTRDGSFEIGLADAQTSTVTTADGSTISINNGYLVDKNGYYVLGEAANAEDGAFSTGGLTPIRIDEWAFANINSPTSTASIDLNLPSTNENVADHLGTVLSAGPGTSNDNLETYSINVIDSNGAKKSVRLNFTKQSNNVWQVSATTSRASSPQVDTINFSGTAEAGDIYSITVTIGGAPTTVTYTSDGAEGGLSGIRDAFIASINADATVAASITASAGAGDGEITLTANAEGASFSSEASVTDGTTAQVDTITIAGTVEAGDEYVFTLASPDNGILPQTISYTVTGAEAGLSEIRDRIIAAFNANAPASATVIAEAGGPAGEITLRAKTAGRSFTTTASTPVRGATADNTAAVTTTIANATGTADNTVAVASKALTRTSAAQTLNFNSDGTISGASPVNLDFSLSFADGATADFTMNFDKMTQYSSDFLVSDYSHDGLASANMTNVKFDDTGQVIGRFSDGTDRSIYKLPLAIFSNPDQLEMMNGMVFRETADSGAPIETFADTSDRAAFAVNALEISNVDLATEFTRMIMVQKAYNSSATVFRTIDEMVQTGRDLKA